VNTRWILTAMLAFLLAVLMIAWVTIAQAADPADLIDTRCCVTPERDKRGEIKRSRSVVTAFRARYACPSTGRHEGACPGWSADHVVPLACGGRDSVTNLQWLPNAIKSGAGTLPKDRWERRVYCR
jgi:hypothetical protein